MNDGRIDGRQALPQPAVAAMMARHVDVPNIFALDRAAEFTMLLAAEGRPAYLHAFLWAFVRAPK